MTIDKLIVTALSSILIAAIYWFFFGKKEEAKEYSSSVEILVDGGYTPATIKIKEGSEIKMTFLRKAKNSCLEELSFPDFKINEYLPLNEKVTVSITPPHKGEYYFHCGMNMFHGKVVVV